MIPATFDYEVAESVEQAIDLLGSREDAKLLAGGHSLIPLMRLRFARPEMLVDIGRLSDLSYIRERDGGLAIGASDIPTVLLALDAELVVRGPEGERTIPAADFFVGFFETALGPQDVLTEIRVPKVAGGGWAYEKFTRRAQDWATVAVAAVRSNGTARVALTNMGMTPIRAAAVEEALASGADAGAAAERAGEGTSPPSDQNGSAEYRRHLATVLARRALKEVNPG